MARVESLLKVIRTFKESPEWMKLFLSILDNCDPLLSSFLRRNLLPTIFKTNTTFDSNLGCRVARSPLFDGVYRIVNPNVTFNDGQKETKVKDVIYIKSTSTAQSLIIQLELVDGSYNTFVIPLGIIKASTDINNFYELYQALYASGEDCNSLTYGFTNPQDIIYPIRELVVVDGENRLFYIDTPFVLPYAGDDFRDIVLVNEPRYVPNLDFGRTGEFTGEISGGTARLASGTEVMDGGHASDTLDLLDAGLAHTSSDIGILDGGHARTIFDGILSAGYADSEFKDLITGGDSDRLRNHFVIKGADRGMIQGIGKDTYPPGAVYYKAFLVRRFGSYMPGVFNSISGPESIIDRIRRSVPIVLLPENTDYRLQVIPQSVPNVSAGTTTFDLKIQGNDEWTLSSPVEWLTLSKTVGSGIDTVIVTVQKNETQSERSAIITLSPLHGDKISISITQDDVTFAVYVLGKGNEVFPYTGGRFRLEIQSSVSWGITNGIPTTFLEFEKTSGTDSVTQVVTVKPDTEDYVHSINTPESYTRFMVKGPKPGMAIYKNILRYNNVIAEFPEGFERVIENPNGIGFTLGKFRANVPWRLNIWCSNTYWMPTSTREGGNQGGVFEGIEWNPGINLYPNTSERDIVTEIRIVDENQNYPSLFKITQKKPSNNYEVIDSVVSYWVGKPVSAGSDEPLHYYVTLKVKFNNLWYGVSINVLGYSSVMNSYTALPIADFDYSGDYEVNSKTYDFKTTTQDTLTAIGLAANVSTDIAKGCYITVGGKTEQLFPRTEHWTGIS